MQREVHFYSEGIKLAGDVYVPDGPGGGQRRPGIVVCMGYTGIKAQGAPQIAAAMNEIGYVALTFDYRGFGMSDGPRWRLMPMEQVEDVRSAMAFLAQQPEVDPARIGLFGTSMGGANVVYAAALDQRARCVVSSVPIGDGERWSRRLRRFWEYEEYLKLLEADRLERALTGKSRYVDPLDIAVPPPDGAEFFRNAQIKFPSRKCEIPLETGEALLHFSPESVADRIAPRPLLVIAAGLDTMSIVDEAVSLYERARDPKRLVLLENLKHFEVSPAAPVALDHAKAWFLEHLGK